MTRFAVATDGDVVAPHFGRCEAYTIVDIEDGQLGGQERIGNPGHEPGFLPAYLAERGVNCIIAGGMGPRAQQLFEQREIRSVVGVSGAIADTIELLLRGALRGGESTCDH